MEQKAEGKVTQEAILFQNTSQPLSFLSGDSIQSSSFPLKTQIVLEELYSKTPNTTHWPYLWASQLTHSPIHYLP